MKGSFPATCVQYNLNSLRKMYYVHLQCILFILKSSACPILLHIEITWGAFKTTDAWDVPLKDSE